MYLAGAALVAAGFVDFPLIAYHFQKTASVPKGLVPVAYAIAMGVSGTGSLIFGRIFDRFGILILVPLTVLSALFAAVCVSRRVLACTPGRSAIGAWHGSA